MTHILHYTTDEVLDLISACSSVLLTMNKFKADGILLERNREVIKTLEHVVKKAQDSRVPQHVRDSDVPVVFGFTPQLPRIIEMVKEANKVVLVLCPNVYTLKECYRRMQTLVEASGAKVERKSSRMHFANNSEVVFELAENSDHFHALHPNLIVIKELARYDK